MTLEEEAERATDLLKGKRVEVVWRYRDGEVVIQFEDGTRFFADAHDGKLELSMTTGMPG